MGSNASLAAYASSLSGEEAGWWASTLAALTLTQRYSRGQARTRETSILGLKSCNQWLRALIGLWYARLAYSYMRRKSTFRAVNECSAAWEAVRVPQDFIEMQCVCAREFSWVHSAPQGVSSYVWWLTRSLRGHVLTEYWLTYDMTYDVSYRLWHVPQPKSYTRGYRLVAEEISEGCIK